jgi:soluble lytic murein transglycosylase
MFSLQRFYYFMLHVQTFRLLALFFVLTVSISAQNANETHQKIRSAMEKKDYAAAISELQNLARNDKKFFALNNYDYLLARLSERNRDSATAMANYQAVVNRSSVLSEYALWHLSQIARASGNLMLERTFLRQLLTVAPNSLLINTAKIRVMRSGFESGDFQAVISGQNSIVGGQNSGQTAQNPAAQNSQTPPNDARTRENLVYLGQSYLQLGKQAEAREVFTRLTNNLPNPAQPDDFALAGARGLDELDGGRENLGKVAPKISDAEHFRRATIYQFNRDFADARLHFAALVEDFPQSTFAPDAMYQIGRGLTLQLNFDEAIKWFERVQAEFPDHPLAYDALNQSASAFSRVNKPNEAITRYQKAIEKFPDAPNPERPFLNIVDIERDSGRNEDALKWIQKTRERFKGKLPEAQAVFVQAKIHIANNDWTNALTDLNELGNFSDLGGMRVPGGTNPTEVTFLKGFVLEQLQRYAEAIDVYLSIPDGRAEYYGWRATERLKLLAQNQQSGKFVSEKLKQFRSAFTAAISQTVDSQNAENIRQETQSFLRLMQLNSNAQNQFLDSLKKAYAILPAYQKVPRFKLLEFGRKEILKEKHESSAGYHQTLADELLFLGLYDEGTPELETALKENAAKSGTNQNSLAGDMAYTLAVYYERGEMANRAVAFIEPLWKNVPADYQIELIPRDQAELLYPAPYADSLLKYSAPRNVDGRFVLSIMRQESRYRADVKSYAAARGLMQFISDTSNRIASELNRKNFSQDELYHPPTAIEFGSQYLADLFKQFPAQPQAVAASYNGGEHNVARWTARAKSTDADRYVPEIVFSQSKDYVYKVMANYRVYQIFYDERMNSK